MLLEWWEFQLILLLEKNGNQSKEAKEQAEAADKLKTEMIDNMEHDIRTPFNALFACKFDGS